jgi:hypothetical protein
MANEKTLTGQDIMAGIAALADGVAKMHATVTAQGKDIRTLQALASHAGAPTVAPVAAAKVAPTKARKAAAKDTSFRDSSHVCAVKDCGRPYRTAFRLAEHGVVVHKAKVSAEIKAKAVRMREDGLAVADAMVA